MIKEGSITSYEYNNLSKLISSVENKDGKETSNKTYTYDVNGNQTKEKDSVTNVTVENTYDVDNRLSISITTNGEKEVVNQENLYNGNGKRIQKKEGNNVVNYFYQDGVVLYTSDKDGNKTSQNFIGTDGNIIGTTRYSSEGFKYYTYNKDVQGSTTSVVGQDGISPVAYDYDDFGVTKTIGDSSFFNEVCYTGGIYDVSTGLYYLNARYYDPNNGRFITQDTYRGEINNPSTLHLYAYCSNNPINYVDPSGHLGIRVTNAIIGGLLTLVLDYTSAFVCYKIAKRRNLTFSKFGIKNSAISIGSGIAGGILMSTRYKKRVQVFGSAAISGIKSILSNAKSKVSITKLVRNVVGDTLLGAAVGWICGDGLGTPHWAKGLFSKGSYRYKAVVLKYGTTVSISSSSLKYTKDVIRSAVKTFAWSVGSSIISTTKSILGPKIKKKFNVGIY